MAKKPLGHHVNLRQELRAQADQLGLGVQISRIKNRKVQYQFTQTVRDKSVIVGTAVGRANAFLWLSAYATGYVSGLEDKGNGGTRKRRTSKPKQYTHHKVTK